MTASAYALAFVVTWSSRNHHVTVWTNQSSADLLQLSTCFNVKLIYVDHSDQKVLILVPPDMHTGVHDTKTEPIAAQLAILPPPYLSMA